MKTIFFLATVLLTIAAICTAAVYAFPASVAAIGLVVMVVGDATRGRT